MFEAKPRNGESEPRHPLLAVSVVVCWDYHGSQKKSWWDAHVYHLWVSGPLSPSPSLGLNKVWRKEKRG